MAAVVVALLLNVVAEDQRLVQHVGGLAVVAGEDHRGDLACDINDACVTCVNVCVCVRAWGVGGAQDETLSVGCKTIRGWYRKRNEEEEGSRMYGRRRVFK